MAAQNTPRNRCGRAIRLNDETMPPSAFFCGYDLPAFDNAIAMACF